MADDLDFSDFDGVEELDWSDVEDELKKNQEMIRSDSTEESATVGDLDEGFLDSGDSESSKKGPTNGEVDVDFLMNIPLSLSVEVGRKKMLIQDLLTLGVESVLELQKKIGEPLNILINNALVAKGEVIVQNEKFGIKIVEIVDKKTRLSTIQSTSL